MRLNVMLVLALGALALSGCKHTQQHATAYEEEPYAPSSTAYASLDSMDAGYSSSAGTSYQPVAPDEPVVEPVDQAAGGAELDEPLAPIGEQTYTIKKGDTLYKLARRFYNDQSRWREIWNANRERILDPDRLPVGLEIVIP